MVAINKKIALFYFCVLASCFLITSVAPAKAEVVTSNCSYTKVGSPKDSPPCSGETGGSGSCEAGTDIGMADGYQDGVLVKIRLCKVHGIEINSRISKNVDLLIVTAKASGLTLTGGGFRTMSEQKTLYSQNCRGKKCSPPTARPGYSNHQMGLAIDFNCSGSLITSHSNKCFAWLSSNASSYGLKNLPSEAWHWSVDGH